jgi:hypothetical protein
MSYLINWYTVYNNEIKYYEKQLLYKQTLTKFKNTLDINIFYEKYIIPKIKKIFKDEHEIKKMAKLNIIHQFSYDNNDNNIVVFGNYNKNNILNTTKYIYNISNDNVNDDANNDVISNDLFINNNIGNLSIILCINNLSYLTDKINVKQIINNISTSSTNTKKQHVDINNDDNNVDNINNDIVNNDKLKVKKQLIIYEIDKDEDENEDEMVINKKIKLSNKDIIDDEVINDDEDDEEIEEEEIEEEEIEEEEIEEEEIEEEEIEEEEIEEVIDKDIEEFLNNVLTSVKKKVKPKKKII